MSVKGNFRYAILTAAFLWAAIVTDTVSARELSDIMSTPFTDPLLSRPPQLDIEKTLPGDTQPFTCDTSKRENTAPLTLSDAVDMALCKQPQIESAWAAIKIQAAQKGGARAAYLPTINLGISRLHQKNTDPQSPFTKDSDRTSDSRYATLTWRLLDFGGRDANYRSANALLEAALANHDAVLQKTLANIIGAYFDALTANANRQAKEKNEILARQTWEIAKKREVRGVAAQSDTLQAKTALARAELESSRTRNIDKKSLTLLALALGFPANSPAAQHLRLTPDYSDTENTLQQDLSSWLSIAQDQHPALLALRAQLESTKEKLTVARSEGLPTIDFTYGRYINGRPNQGISSSRSKESVIGIALNIPLFDGFANTYKVRGAQAQIEMKAAEIRESENQILSEIAKTHADAVAALNNLDASKKLTEAAQDALDIVNRKSERGVTDILDMLNVQMALADSEQERIKSLAEWRSARLRLLANAGLVSLKDFQKN